MAALFSTISSCGSNTPDQVSYQVFEKTVQLDNPLTILDVRTPEEYGTGHIPEAININFYDDNFISKVEQTIPQTDKVAVYCRSGKRSAQAAVALKKKGYNVVDIAGGIMAWEEAGLPVTTENIDIYLNPEQKKIEIQPLIHASLRINYDGKEIEVDPVGTLGDRTTDYSKFPKADLILVTHEHHDHLDPAAIKTLSDNDTIVVTNQSSANILGYGVVMKNGDIKEIDGIGIEAVAAYNTSPDRLQFHPKGRDNGYILNLGGTRIYIAGDTEVTPEMSQLGEIDIAFLPCNLPYTMTPEQLIEAAGIIKPKVVYPYHYGNTDLSPIIPALAPEGIYVRICPFDPGSK